MEQASALDDIQALIVQLRDEFQVKHAVYHWLSADGEQYGFGTYDPVWVQRYTENDYMRIDPVVIGSFQRFHPVDWRELDWSSRAVQAFRKDSIKHGVGTQGFSFPIRGPNGQLSLLSTSDSTDDASWDDFTKSNQREWIVIAHCLNRKTLELVGCQNPETMGQLSPRGIEALTYLGMGHVRAQVAELLNISEHTLRAYIESARFKLGASNTTHAVARAVAEGLIVLGGTARPTRSRLPLAPLRSV